MQSLGLRVSCAVHLLKGGIRVFIVTLRCVLVRFPAEPSVLAQGKHGHLFASILLPLYSPLTSLSESKIPPIRHRQVNCLAMVFSCAWDSR